LPNKGLDGYLAEDLPKLATLPVPLIVNVMGFSREEVGELVSAFAERARECVAAARAAGGGRVVSVRTASLSLEEYVATRVVEAVIHGLDLARALDRDPWTTPLGADIASAVLGGLLPKGSRRPAIDDVAFLEAATGRLPLSDELRAAFGRAADALPLIS
jgi:hypothetical protein